MSVGVAFVMCTALSVGLDAMPFPDTIHAPIGFDKLHFQTLWFKRLEAERRGEFAVAQKLLDGIIADKLRAGWPDMPRYAAALAIESRVARMAGQHAQGLSLAHAAAVLAPHRPTPMVAEAQLLWARGHTGAACKALMRAVMIMFREPPYAQTIGGGLVLIVLAATYGAAAIFCLVCLYRHRRPVMHVTRHHALPAGAQWLQVHLIVGLTFALPLLLRWGVVGACTVWVLLLLPLLRGTERGVAITVLAGMLASTWLLPLGLTQLDYVGSRQQLLYEVLRDVDAEAAAVALSEGPVTAEDRWALGLRARWRGDTASSRADLEKAASMGLTAPEFLLALGNVRFYTGDVQGATAAYRQILATEPSYVPALFNLSQVYLSLIDARSDTVRQQANTVDFRLVAALARHVQRTGLPVVEPSVATSLLRRTTPQPQPARSTHVAEVWRWVGGGLSPLLVQIASAVGIGLGLVFRQAKIRRDAPPVFGGRWLYPCRSCDTVFCSRCNAQAANGALCPDCYLNFVANSVAPGRAYKHFEARQCRIARQALQRVSRWLLPGAAHMLGGRFVAGYLLAITFLTAIFGLAQGLGGLPNPAPLYSGAVGVGHLLFGCLGTGAYVAAIVAAPGEET